MNNFPYKEYEGTEIWNKIDEALANLEKNHDIQVTGQREHIIGYLCKNLKS